MDKELERLADASLERSLRTHGTVSEFPGYTVPGERMLLNLSMGASASEAVAIPDLSSRQLFFQMFMEYERKYRMQGGVFATYDLLLIQARDSRVEKSN